MNAKAEKWIFVSSPGDVAAERVIADRVFRRLAKEFDESVTLRLVLWEFEPLFAHGNFQRQIRKPSECDLMVTVLWTRLGTRLPAEFSPGPGCCRQPAPSTSCSRRSRATRAMAVRTS